MGEGTPWLFLVDSELAVKTTIVGSMQLSPAGLQEPWHGAGIGRRLFAMVLASVCVKALVMCAKVTYVDKYAI